MGNGRDDEASGADAIEDGIRRAADHQFADAGLRADVPQIGMNPQRFNHRNDARGQSFRGVRLVQRHECANFLQAGQSQGRPDDLQRARYLGHAF